jgi:hypothetical protein
MKRLNAGLLVFAMVLSLVGCGGAAQEAASLNGAYDDEIITTKAVDQDKTMITVRVENSVGQSCDLEGILEKQFPDVDFVLVHDGSVSSEYNIRADLVNGTECDFIFSRRLNLVDDIASEYLLDLSSESFVDNYFMSAVDSCAGVDGGLYYLPGPSDIYGIVYDKTMFDENGWKLPGSYSEFVELIKTINDAGLKVTYMADENTDDSATTSRAKTSANGSQTISDVVAIQPTMMYPDMFQVVFNTYSFEDVYQGTDNYSWLSDYQNGTGSMVGHMEPAVEKFEKLFDDGILSLVDWDVQPATRSNMMYKYHNTAMVIECENAMNYAKTFAEEAGGDDVYHEVAMMPFWTSDEEDSDYLYSIPSYFMAINKKSAEESEEKKELLLQVYEYLSSVEGQEALINGTSQISNVQGVDMDEGTFSDAIRETVSEGRIISNFYLAKGENSKQVEKQLRSTVPDLIAGNMSTKDWLLAADQVRDDFLAGTLTQEESYGTVETTLTRLESAYTLADMYRELTSADVGIALGGIWRNGTNGHFYEGDITDSSLTCVTPDKEASADENEFAGTIVTSTMTGQQILDILNSAATSSDNDATNVYYVASGLTVEFNPWASEGERVVSCKTSDGKDINADDSYKVAYFYGSLPDGSADPEESLGQTWQESFLAWLATKDGVIKKPDMTLTLTYGN